MQNAEEREVGKKKKEKKLSGYRRKRGEEAIENRASRGARNSL